MRRLYLAGIYCLAASLAFGQAITPGASTPYLYVAQTNNGALASSTAAINTEEPLGVCQSTIPAGKFQRVGDTIHVTFAVDFAANTDTKTAQFRFNGITGGVFLTLTSSVAAQARGNGEVTIRKSGASTQSWKSFGSVVNNGNANGTNNSAPASNNDTLPIVIMVTGKSFPNSFGAGAVTCNDFAVDFAAGP
jgi:hypothetical protein